MAIIEQAPQVSAQEQQARIQQQQALAKALMQGGQIDQGRASQMVSGHVVPVAPVEAILKGLQAGYGSYLDADANKRSGKLEASKQQAFVDALKGGDINYEGLVNSGAIDSNTLAQALMQKKAQEQQALAKQQQEQAKQDAPTTGMREALWAAGGDEDKAREILQNKMQDPFGQQRFNLLQSNTNADNEARQRALTIQENQFKLQQAESERKSTEVAKPKPLTDSQSKYAIFGDRASKAHDILGNIKDNYSPVALNAATALEGVPGAGWAANAALGENEQLVGQAQRDFINAVLRNESGALISPAEFANAKKQYFPQPGDGPEVIEQKRINRETEINGLIRGAGAALNEDQPVATVQPSQQKSQGKPIIHNNMEFIVLPDGTYARKKPKGGGQ